MVGHGDVAPVRQEWRTIRAEDSAQVGGVVQTAIPVHEVAHVDRQEQLDVIERYERTSREGFLYAHV